MLSYSVFSSLMDWEFWLSPVYGHTHHYSPYIYQIVYQYITLDINMSAEASKIATRWIWDESSCYLVDHRRSCMILLLTQHCPQHHQEWWCILSVFMAFWLHPYAIWRPIFISFHHFSIIFPRWRCCKSTAPLSPWRPLKPCSSHSWAVWASVRATTVPPPTACGAWKIWGRSSRTPWKQWRKGWSWDSAGKKYENMTD